MFEKRLIIRPEEYKLKHDQISQERIQNTVYDLILRIDKLRTEILPNLNAALLDPHISDEERKRREKVIGEIVTRIESADHLMAEMEQYIHTKHASLARLIEDDRFKHLQHLVAIIERAVSEEALPGVLHAAGEHIKNSNEPPLLLPDSFHPEWYSEADIEEANHLLALDLEELIGPDIELKDHLDKVTGFLFDPLIIVELKRRIELNDVFQPTSLLFIKEMAPEVWDSLITLLDSSCGKDILLHILGRPRDTAPSSEELEAYKTQIYKKLPNVVSIALSYSIKNLKSEIKNIRQEEHSLLEKFYGTSRLSFDKIDHKSLLHKLWMDEMLQGIEQQNVADLFKLLGNKKTEELIANPTAVREALEIFRQDVSPKMTAEQRKKTFSLCYTVLPKLFDYSLELKRIIDKKEEHLWSETIKTKASRLLLPKNRFDRGQTLEKEKVREMKQEMFRSLRIIQLLLQNMCYILKDFPEGEVGINFNRVTSAIKGVLGVTDASDMHGITAETCRRYIMKVRYHSENFTNEQIVTLKNAQGFYLAEQDLSSGGTLELDLSGWDFTKANLDRIKPEGTKFSTTSTLPNWIHEGLDENGIYRQEILISKIDKNEVKKVPGVYIEEARAKNFLGDMRGCLLKHMSLDYGNITANLRNSTLIDISVDSANISYTDLRGARLDFSNIHNAHLRYVKLDGAKISIGLPYWQFEPKADIFTYGLDEQSYFRRSLLIENIKEGKGSRFVGIVLRNANFSGLERNKTKFEEMDMRGSTFSLGSLIDCTFINCILKNSHFFGTNLKGTTFEGCNLTGANFIGAENIPTEIEQHLDENGIYRTNITNPETPPNSPPTHETPES